MKEPWPIESAFLFPSISGGKLSADAVQDLVNKHVAAARTRCPSLVKKRVTPHVLRHYLPFRTMSCNGELLRIWIGNFRSRRAKPPDIARHSLVPSTGSPGRRGVDRWNRDQRISLLTRWPSKRSDMCWKRGFQSPRQNYLVIDNTLHGGLLSRAWG
jgi:hypothetical protein